MEKNIYYDNFKPLFLKAESFSNELVWNEIYKALEKLRPEKAEKELYRQILECFKRFEVESKNDKMTIFFLSFLIKLTNDVKYFEKLLQLCIDSKGIPVNSKFYIYNYCCELIKNRFYFQNDKCLMLMNVLYDICFKMNEKYLNADLNDIEHLPMKDSVLLVISSLGKYPFGSIKHLLDVCRILSNEKKRIKIFITHEKSFKYGKINLYPLSAYGLDDEENTSDYFNKFLMNNNIEIYEFNSKGSFVSEAKQAVLKIRKDMPSYIINFSDKNFFIELLRLKINVVDIKNIEITESYETQKVVKKYIKEAWEQSNKNDFKKAAQFLYYAYELIGNNGIKVEMCMQLIDFYLRAEMKDKALECACNLTLLDRSPSVIDCLARAYEETGEYKNAIFLYEKNLKTGKNDYFYNQKLFGLYLNEKLYKKASIKNEYFINMSDSNLEFLRYQFYYNSFMEAEAFNSMDKGLRLLKETNEMKVYASRLITAVGSSLYYNAYNDEKYCKLLKELYNVIIPVKENLFTLHKPKDKLINLGFLTGEAARHPVGFFIVSLFKNKSKDDRFKYYFYYSSKSNDEDEYTENIKKNTDVYKYVGNIPDEEISKIILSDKIDILIDLNGISEVQKINILVERLAPIQMTWIGFPGTLPIKNIDFNIVDHYTDPVGIADKFYTEKLLYLPKTFLCYGIKTDTEITEPPRIKNKYVTFGSFSNSSKYSDEILMIWGMLLRENKDAKLVIRTDAASNEFTKEKLTQKFIKNEIDIDRVEIRPTTYRMNYFAGYNEVDIILDTFPFNGATTTCDAFLMGTPVISLYGTRHASRVGLSMLNQVGLSDLAVSCGEDYIKKAAELSNDVNRLNYLNQNLRKIAESSPIMNHDEFKKDFEEAIYETYISFQKG